MYEEFFTHRLYELRDKKGVSARDMSLSIGQNAGYINAIENGKAFPSMENFFYICEYLEVTPKEFFDMEQPDPVRFRHLSEYARLLNEEQFDSFLLIMRDLTKSEKKK